MRDLNYLSRRIGIYFTFILLGGIIYLGSLKLLLVLSSVLLVLYSVQYFYLKKLPSKLLVRIFLLLVILAIRLLFVEAYYIPSNSMESTLFPGDWVLVVKPVFERDNVGESSFIKRNDLIVFESEILENTMVKRCVAIANDTLSIRDGLVFINGVVEKEPLSLTKYYRLTLKKKVWADAFLKKFHTSYVSMNIGMIQASDTFSSFVSLANLQLIRKDPRVKNIGIDPNRPDTAYTVYPNDAEVKWKLDEWGPVVMPAQGGRMFMDSIQLRIYQPLIRQYEMESGQVSDCKTGWYQFENSYCFVMGDNRYNSRDSRYIGPIPYRDVIGKVVCVLYSPASPKGQRWFKWL